MTDAGSTVACYYCGGRLSAEKPGRLDECTGCGKYIHACRMCEYYDPGETSKQCREDDAEEVRDKQAANFCDYFRLATRDFDAAQINSDLSARSQLAELFGEPTEGSTAAADSDDSRLTQDAEALFRK